MMGGEVMSVGVWGGVMEAPWAKRELGRASCGI